VAISFTTKPNLHFTANPNLPVISTKRTKGSRGDIPQFEAEPDYSQNE